MNNALRKRIDGVMSDVEAMASALKKIEIVSENLEHMIEQYQSFFENIRINIEEIKDEESEKYENLPDSLKNSERGYSIEAAINKMEEAMNLCDEILVADVTTIGHVDLNDIVSALDEAKSS